MTTSIMDSQVDCLRTQDSQVPQLGVVVQNVTDLQLGKLAANHCRDVKLLVRIETSRVGQGASKPRVASMTRQALGRDGKRRIGGLDVDVCSGRSHSCCLLSVL